MEKFKCSLMPLYKRAIDKYNIEETTTYIQVVRGTFYEGPSEFPYLPCISLESEPLNTSHVKVTINIK